MTKGFFPDPHQVCDDVEESLKLIKDVVIDQGLVECHFVVSWDMLQLNPKST
ncbi:hypothetical protein NC651_040123 [Populus alba x Populus x berolinensis]|nr:hypothetical protein NC651_040123 [Populus alba x Populus x berolinensis]